MSAKPLNTNWDVTEEVLTMLTNFDIALKAIEANIENKKDELGDSYDKLKNQIDQLRKTLLKFYDSIANYHNFYVFKLKKGINITDESALQDLQKIQNDFYNNLDEFKKLLEDFKKLI